MLDEVSNFILKVKGKTASASGTWGDLLVPVVPAEHDRRPQTPAQNQRVDAVHGGEERAGHAWTLARSGRHEDELPGLPFAWRVPAAEKSAVRKCQQEHMKR